MLSLTFYGGVNEIGGNKILLADGNSRIFFDFGVPFGKRRQYFEEYLNPRPGAGLLDLLEMGLLPPLGGIYRHDLVADALRHRFQSSPLFRELEVAGVLLSHAHIDHSGYISFLRQDIPIYATAMTAFISKAIQDSGSPDFEREVCYLSPRESREGYLSPVGGYQQRPFIFVDGFPAGNDALAFWHRSPARSKSMKKAAVSSAPEKVGDLALRYFPVDHSIFGAAAFAVETSLGWVGYTGDIRLHGRQAYQTEHFIGELERLHPYILLCEGTRAGDERYILEEEVYENAWRVAKETSGLVIADFGPRNIERLLTFHRIAQETNRMLVILAKDAYLLDAMRLVSREVPQLEASPDILIYKDLRGRLSQWEEELRHHYMARLVSAPQIRDQPNSFILCFSFQDINDLIDIAPRGGAYIYSSTEAYHEEQEIDLWRLRNWVRHFDLRFMTTTEVAEEKLHASGHASGPELLELIQRIGPKVLIPVHTEDPGYFGHNLGGTGIEVRIPAYGEEIRFP